MPVQWIKLLISFIHCFRLFSQLFFINIIAIDFISKVLSSKVTVPMLTLQLGDFMVRMYVHMTSTPTPDS